MKLSKISDTVKFIGVAILSIIAFFTLSKYISKQKKDIAANNAAADALNNPTQMQPDPSGTSIRTPVITNVVETVRNEIKSYFQDEQLMVDTLNTLASPTEVIAASTLYRNNYGKSLKSDVKGALYGNWKSPNKLWAELKKYVQDNIS